MKYYIDIGTYDGELLEKVICKFDPFDKYIGFEPVPELYLESVERFKNNDNVLMINKAASTINDKNVKFYMCYCKEKGGCKGSGEEIGTGSTLLKNKERGNINELNFIYVETIDFSKYIIDTFKKTDEITLKIDIEGEEYNLFKSMIKRGSIKYINKIYCEWHYHKMKGYKKDKEKFKKMHYKMIKNLNRYGFDLKGNNVEDEMDYIMKRKDI